MWSDREADHDFLGYAGYVKVLANICTHKDLAPLTLGIFGSWGSGKTSLMKMLRAHLDDEKKRAQGPRITTLWFNAWRYEGKEEAQSALINALLAKLAEDTSLMGKAGDLFSKLRKSVSAMKVAKVIGKSIITLTPQIDELVESFKDESEKLAETMDSFNRDLEALLARAGVGRVIVFIDDLDRCSSEKVIETFETIKLFLTTPACTFVIGADAARIEHAVGEVYKGASETKHQRDYLEKIIQLPFTIPEQDLKDVICYVGMLMLSRHLDRSHWGRLAEARAEFHHSTSGPVDAVCSWPASNRAVFGQTSIDEVTQGLKAIMPHVDSLARGLRGNPRQIKRFLNILSMRQQLAAENALEIDAALLVKLAVVEYAWPDFFKAITDTVDPATGCSALLAEVAKSEAGEESDASESELLGTALNQPGLVSYLMLAPQIGGELDLAPYLFLAQTSLTRDRRPALLPLDQQARDLAAGIQGDDRLKSRVAAKRAAASDPATASAVIRVLLTDLAAATTPGARTHIIEGLREVCEKHPTHFATAVAALEQLDPKGQDAVAIAAGAFLSAAGRAGAAVSPDLLSRLAAASPIAAALAPKKKTGRK